MVPENAAITSCRGRTNILGHSSHRKPSPESRLSVAIHSSPLSASPRIQATPIVTDIGNQNCGIVDGYR